MLALKQALSIVSTKNLGSWKPTDEIGLVAWWKNKVGITLTPSTTRVESWIDSGPEAFDMVQATESERPAYDSATGALTFDSSNSQSLQMQDQISIAGEFTIGIRLRPSSFNNAILGDNTTGNEYFKYTTDSNIRIKVDGGTANINLDSGVFGNDYLVITRNASDVLSLYQNGTLQTTTATLSGTSDIDAIGIRATNVNPYSGDILEIQIYNSTSAALIANVNNRLSNL
tara:strand:- start:157 stop:843 length:687 start_codon:yes stop_codon:yes gene_type:complete